MIQRPERHQDAGKICQIVRNRSCVALRSCTGWSPDDRDRLQLLFVLWGRLGLGTRALEED